MLHSCICVQSFLYFMIVMHALTTSTQRLVDWVDGLSGWLVWAVVIHTYEAIHVLRLPLQVANNKQVWHVHTCRLVTLVCVHESLTCSGYCMVRRVVLFTMDFLLYTQTHCCPYVQLKAIQRHIQPAYTICTHCVVHYAVPMTNWKQPERESVSYTANLPFDRA